MNDIGSCNNIWAQTTTDKEFTLTRTAPGQYNLKVTSKGTLVTLAGMSPGACAPIQTVNNGSLVPAGITGTTDQTYTGVAYSAVVPSHVTGTYAQVPDFLNAVFGAGHYTTNYAVNGGYGWIGHYETPSNGFYLDIEEGWTLHNLGDIK